ncbi:MAG: hypothetical protein ACM3JI_01210 [Anaerolineae bacterium]
MIKRAQKDLCEKGCAMLDPIADWLAKDEMVFSKHSRESKAGWNFYATNSPHIHIAMITLKTTIKADFLLAAFREYPFSVQQKFTTNEGFPVILVQLKTEEIENQHEMLKGMLEAVAESFKAKVKERKI